MEERHLAWAQAVREAAPSGSSPVAGGVPVLAAPGALRLTHCHPTGPQASERSRK